jgi:hypothetical protein
MDNLVQIVSVPVITSLVYGAMQLYKYTVNGNEKCVRLIPVISVVLGAALGVTAFYAVRQIIAADNVLNAVLIGGVSGLAATGSHQLAKQLFGNGSGNTEEKE